MAQRGSFLLRNLAVLSALVVTVALPGEAWAGKLSKARSSARGSSSSSSGDGSSSSSSSSDGGGRWGGRSGRHFRPWGVPGYYSAFDWGNSWYWWMFSPWWWPHQALSDNWDRPVAFPGAPYEDGINGYLRVQGETPAAPGSASVGGRQVLGSGSALRLWAEGGAESADLHRAGGGFLWSGYHRLELGGDLRHYWERLEDGTQDRQWLGSLWASLLFAQGPHVQFRTGVGARWMPTDVDTILGGYFLYGLDLYPTQPLVISLQGDVGVLGEAVSSSMRGTLGVIVDHVEVYGGYEVLRIGDVDLDNWIGGVRLWQ